MKKAVTGSDGYLKRCVICDGYIENEMYETVGNGLKIRYFHKKCYTAGTVKNVGKGRCLV